jgi:hypothetical protein
MDYDKIVSLSKLCDLLERILAGEEFVEVKLGNEQIGGSNLRIKGNTVHCNVVDLPTFSFEIPDAVMNKASEVHDRLVAKLKAVTS